MNNFSLWFRSLDDLRSNYAGWEDGSTVGSAFLNYKYDGAGHGIVTECLNELNKAFDGQQWGNNGPGLITRTLIQMCKFQNVSYLLEFNIGSNYLLL